MEVSEENSVPSFHGDQGKHMSQQQQQEEEEEQKLGLGFHSSPAVDPDPNPDPPTPGDSDQQTANEELQFQQKLNQEFRNLVLEGSKTVSEKLSDREEDDERVENEANERDAESEVGFEGDAKEEEGFDYGDEVFDDTSKEYNYGIGNGVEGLNDGKNKRYNTYPLRPDAEDCPYYVRNGTCKFGSNCKFNHPLSKRNQHLKTAKEKEEYSERPGQIECKYHLSSGGCKYGNKCRYNHSRGKTPAAPVVEFNFLGLPIRPGGKECPYYMRNGSCKYGPNCRFNHPDPTAVGGGDNSSGYLNGGTVSLQAASPMPSWSSPRALNETMLPVMFSPTNGVPPPTLEWNGYQAHVYPPPERRLPTPPAFALNSLADSNFYPHHKLPMLVDEFPERPGELECSYFMKTGDCKYRSGCKFHHPKNRIPKSAACTLSDMGLPLRPDQSVCSYYNRYGICKYGPACKFDHPVNYGNSASSAVSGPNGPSFYDNSAIH